MSVVVDDVGLGGYRLCGADAASVLERETRVCVISEIYNGSRIPCVGYFHDIIKCHNLFVLISSNRVGLGLVWRQR